MSTIQINNDFARHNAIKQIQALNLSAGMEVVIRPYRKNRSNSQNSLMWLWLSVIQTETGNDKDALHDYFRDKYLGRDQIDVLGQQRMVLKSTTKLKTAEFTQYLTQIEAFCATELGITLPHPKDTYDEAMAARFA